MMLVTSFTSADVALVSCIPVFPSFLGLLFLESQQNVNIPSQ